MNRLARVSVLMAVLVVCTPSFAHAAAIQVNGICQLGNCSTPDTLPLDDSLIDAFDFNFIFPNSDMYRLQGAVGAFSSSAPLQWLLNSALAVTFVGNSAGGPSGDDVLVVDFLQNFANSNPGGGGTFFEFINGDFDGSFAGASSVSGQLFVNATPLPLLGPYLPPDPFSELASGFPIGNLQNPLLVDSRYTITFGAGSQPGATVVVGSVPLAPIPEPGTLALFVVGALGLAMKRKSRDAWWRCPGSSARSRH